MSKEVYPIVRCAGGCGRPVSSNKHRCRACIEEAAHAHINAKNEEPMDNATHIIMKFPTEDREDLYRADGMLLASRQKDMVRFGNEPKEPGNRLFLNPQFAAAWLRKIPAMDLITRKDGRLNVTDAIEHESAGTPVVIEERDAEHTIIQPGGSSMKAFN